MNIGPYRWHYQCEGPPEAPVLLALHGFMGRGADWLALRDCLGGRYRLLLPDLPGHGATDVAGGAEHFAMPAVADALLQLLAALNIRQAALLGYSMGGRLALYMALHRPDIYTRLVVESASPGLQSAAERAARRQWDDDIAGRLERENFTDFLADWYGMPLFASLREHAAFGRIARSRAANRPAELARCMRGMGTGSQPDLWPLLAQSSVPILAMAGAKDEKYCAIVRRMAACTATLQSCIIAGAGHNIHAEQPFTFCERINEFLGIQTGEQRG